MFVGCVQGYPFDVPEAGASLLTYCCLVYHLPLVIAFSVRQRTSFVWGGCMLLPLADLRSDAHGIMHSWSPVCHFTTYSGSKTHIYCLVAKRLSAL